MNRLIALSAALSVASVTPALAAFAPAPQTPPGGGVNTPGAPISCDGRLNDQFNRIKADSGLTAAQRDQRLTEVWDLCGTRLMESMRGEFSMGLSLAIDASVEAAIDGADKDSTDARADAAVAGLRAISEDPEHQVTNALVAQYRSQDDD